MFIVFSTASINLSTALLLKFTISYSICNFFELFIGVFYGCSVFISNHVSWPCRVSAISWVLSLNLVATIEISCNRSSAYWIRKTSFSSLTYTWYIFLLSKTACSLWGAMSIFLSLDAFKSTSKELFYASSSMIWTLFSSICWSTTEIWTSISAIFLSNFCFSLSRVMFDCFKLSISSPVIW